MGTERAILSQHKHRAAARLSRIMWKRWQRQAREGDIGRRGQFAEHHASLVGEIVVEPGGRHAHERWAVFCKVES